MPLYKVVTYRVAFSFDCVIQLSDRLIQKVTVTAVFNLVIV